MSSDTIFGACVTGSLRYNALEHEWAVRVGQLLAQLWIYRLIGETPELKASNSSRISSIDHELQSQGIPTTLTIALQAYPNRLEAATRLVHDSVAAKRGEQVIAVMLVAESTYDLHRSWTGRPGLQSDTHYQTMTGWVTEMMDEIQNRCSTLAINTDRLGKLIMEKATQSTEQFEVRSLLTRLSKPLDVLIMSADPLDESRLKISRELRDLNIALQRTGLRGSINVHSVGGCRIQDLNPTINQYKPTVLHFSGHGNKANICLEDDRGNAQDIDGSAFARLLGLKKSIQLVILNSCSSADLAQVIADEVGYAIGMKVNLFDEDAASFSREFYGALGHGQSIEEAVIEAKTIVQFSDPTFDLIFAKKSP